MPIPRAPDADPSGAEAAVVQHARALLDVSIRVLEYLHQYAANNSAMGQFTAPEKAKPGLVEEAEKAKPRLAAFGRLNDNSH